MKLCVGHLKASQYVGYLRQFVAQANQSWAYTNQGPQNALSAASRPLGEKELWN